MSTRKMLCAAGCVAAVLLAVQAGVALASTMTLDATSDVFIREKDPYKDTTYTDDGVSVWSSQSYPGESYKRRGAIEFDLNDVTQEITGAYLKLYAIDSTVNDTAVVQTAASLHVHGTLDSMTWNNMGTYTDPPGGTGATDLESLGYFNIAENQPRGQYYSSANASANDLVELNAMRTSTEKKFTLFLLNQSGSGVRDWADAGNGEVAQLVVTTIPEPSTIILLAIGSVSLMAYAWRKRR